MTRPRLQESEPHAPRCRYCDGELEPEDIALGFKDAHYYCEMAESEYREYCEHAGDERDDA